MTNNEVLAYLKTLNGKQLADLKNEVEQQMDYLYYLDENFWMRDKIDNYLYVIYYIDGSYYTDCIGKRAYERYMGDPNAFKICYKTKDLFPTYGTLLVKESYGQDTV